MYSFHKQDKIFASDLYGRLQWLAYRLGLFPFRKQAMPFLTVDAIIGNQAFSIADVIVCSGLCYNKVISNFFKSS